MCFGHQFHLLATKGQTTSIGTFSLHKITIYYKSRSSFSLIWKLEWQRDDKIAIAVTTPATEMEMQATDEVFQPMIRLIYILTVLKSRWRSPPFFRLTQFKPSLSSIFIRNFTEMMQTW
ncbi:hypothetical protein [Phormidium sp. CCY1219]|uniref:hypothetical protein n=1 Tax=Phormidium sp. CCY1219 TaxID=2886104 RepID=UPI002D1F410D|nr:hypothetical protein [Phormidium sp. CCY1219]MEB3831197.1 hypothetical protein [Phormidium sp. CCY1219]